MYGKELFSKSILTVIDLPERMSRTDLQAQIPSLIEEIEKKKKSGAIEKVCYATVPVKCPMAHALLVNFPDRCT